MLLSNFCLLAGVEPMQVNDWFLAAFVDAYQWVMLPNVLGMGLNADGGRTATKPYIASANYIHKMSDYCAGCRYAPKARTCPDACPFNFLYWNFLLKHEATLRRNPRLGNAVLGLRYLDDDERARACRNRRRRSFRQSAIGEWQGIQNQEATRCTRSPGRLLTWRKLGSCAMLSDTSPAPLEL
ncbi:MAG: hypothetical protein V9H69_22955 [Anaerolineae bacterium]